MTKIRLPLIIMAAILTTAIGHPSALAAEKAVSATLTPEEKANAEALIEQLNDPAWKVRRTAQTNLEKLGPGILPVVEKYLTDPRPEVAARAKSLLEKFPWATSGVIFIPYRIPWKQGESDLKPGDVILKADGQNITEWSELNELQIAIRKQHRKDPNKPKEPKLTVLRDGKYIELSTWAGFGTYSTWCRNQGGQDHIDAVVALSSGRQGYEKAYAALRRAHADGVRDPFSTHLLWALAEYFLDHDTAMEVFRDGDGTSDPYFNWSIAANIQTIYSLPAYGPYMDFILTRVRENPTDTSALETLESLVRQRVMSNYPLLRELLFQEWTKSDAFSDNYIKASVALVERRWEDVLDIANHESRFPYANNYGVIAAIQLGRLDEAERFALTLMNDKRFSDISPEFALYALAAATAAGKNDMTAGLLKALQAKPDRIFHDIPFAPAARICLHASTTTVFFDAMRPRLTKRQFVETDYTVLLRYDVYRNGLTLGQWQKNFEGIKLTNAVVKQYGQMENARGLLRFGQYEQAKVAMKDFGMRRAFLPAFYKAADFLAAHADRLEQDWKPLKGTIQMYDAAEKDAYWAVRYDGAVFFIDTDGKLHSYPGLAPGELHYGLRDDRMLILPTGTLLVRRPQVYLFDKKTQRWIPTYASACLEVTRAVQWDHPTAPPLLDYVAKHYPAQGEGREIVAIKNVGMGDWRMYQFNGDLVIMIDGKTNKIVDLPAEIARQAGKKKPVAVYIPGRFTKETLLIPTNAGLWTMGLNGQIHQIKLPIKNSDVMTVILPYPHVRGKSYVGIAPQQGGAIFEIDQATGQATLTGGYCALGPNDAAMTRLKYVTNNQQIFCDATIQRLYEQRLARESAKAEVK